MMSFRLVRWSAFAVAVCACGCGKEPAKVAPPAAGPPVIVAPQPALPGDRSLTPGEYVALGLPVHDHEWTGPEVARAGAALTKLSQEDSSKLPRYNSPRSGPVFARVTDTSALAYFKRADVPIATRFPVAIGYFTALDGILKAYLTADPRGATLGTEQLEVMGLMLRATVVMIALVDEFFSTLDPNDPTFAARKRGLETMRAGTAATVRGNLIVLTETQYTEASRTRLLSVLEETLPLLYPRLPEDARAEIPVRLRELEADARLTFAKDRLRALREKLPAK